MFEAGENHWSNWESKFLDRLYYERQAAIALHMEEEELRLLRQKDEAPDHQFDDEGRVIYRRRDLFQWLDDEQQELMS